MDNEDVDTRLPVATWTTHLSPARLLAAMLAIAMIVAVFSLTPKASANVPTSGSSTPVAGGERAGEAESRELAKLAGLPSLTEEGHQVNLRKAEAWRLADGGWFVSAPATGDGVYMATVSATLSPDKELIQTSQAVFTGDEQGGHASIWVDGEKVVDDYFSNVPEGDDVVVPMFSWGKFNDCLASAGIASWVIAALGTACGVACGATAGAGCVACMVGLGLVGGGTIGYCMEEAQ